MIRTVTLKYGRDEVEAILLKHVEAEGYEPARRVIFRCTDNPVVPDLYDATIEVNPNQLPPVDTEAGLNRSLPSAPIYPGELQSLREWLAKVDRAASFRGSEGYEGLNLLRHSRNLLHEIEQRLPATDG